MRETQSTSTTLLGVMATFLVKQPPEDTDRGHGLKSVIMVPLAEDTKEFSARFGCDVFTVFNMTEISSPLFDGPNPGPLTSCGKPQKGVDVRLVDENDCEVAPGSVGEMILRTDTPWAMNHGYLGNPEATARAWRNGWFHTGDAFRTDEHGNYFFVDRMKDAIRRRGENISSFEVEMEVCAHPAVKEAAVVAVPSEHGEDEVLAAISLAPGAELDPADLIAFLIPRMAHFMVPRYVRIVDLLPRTPTQKVEKHLIRSEGIVPGTFDRIKAGINVKRDRIGEKKSRRKGQAHRSQTASSPRSADAKTPTSSLDHRGASRRTRPGLPEPNFIRVLRPHGSRRSANGVAPHHEELRSSRVSLAPSPARAPRG